MAGAASDRIIVDSTELRGLATSAGTQRSRVEIDEGRAARIIASVDRTGWNAGALDSWSRVKGALDTLQADLVTIERDLVRRAALVDLANQPYNPFNPFSHMLPFWLDQTGMTGFPNQNLEWQQLLANLPPGWADLNRRQRLAVIDQIQFGQLGNTPFAPPPPPPQEQHNSLIDNVTGAMWGEIARGGSWVGQQFEGFGTGLYDQAKGDVQQAVGVGAAFFRDLVNGAYFVAHGGLSNPLQAGPPLLPGPGLVDVLKTLPGNFWQGLKAPVEDLMHGHVGRAAADLLSLIGPTRVFRFAKGKLGTPGKGGESGASSGNGAGGGDGGSGGPSHGGSGSGGSGPTGTVWGSIQPTHGVYPGSVVPRSFNLMWVVSSSTLLQTQPNTSWTM